jgi:hypothetical protein
MFTNRDQAIPPLEKPGKDRMAFLNRKRAIFRCSKELKGLSGGVVLYAAQANPQIDAATAEKGRFRAETRQDPIPQAPPEI